MIPLPDKIVLDFLDWLNSELCFKGNPMDMEMLDRHTLNHYAGEFVNETRKQKDRSKDRIYEHIYEFGRVIKSNYPELSAHIDCIEREFTRYVQDTYRRDTFKRYEYYDPEYLVESVLFYLNNNDLQRKDISLSFMISSNHEISPIIDFCDWLKEKNLFVPMPSEITQNMIKEYVKDRRRNLSRGQRKNLENILKPNIYIKIKDYIYNIGKKHYYPIDKIFYRYKGSGFKCMILPLKGSEDLDLKAFIKRYWEDLNKMSGDKLDIFYAVKELEETGYSIKEYFGMDNLSSELIPCIAIWRQKIEKAQYISINGLDSQQLVQLFSVIVSSIERGKSIEEICRIGDEKVNNLKDSKKNIMNYYTDNSTNNVHQYFENINGEVIGFNKGIIEKTFCDNNHANELCQFVDDVRDRLSQISEMNETQKRYFENILDGLKEPDLKNNEVQKNNLKMRFESYIMGLPQKVFDVLNVSGSLASIASFLDINISNLI